MIALKILDMLLRLYMLIVLAVVIIRVLQVTPNKWTNLLDRMTEPLLSPIRAQLNIVNFDCTWITVRIVCSDLVDESSVSW